MPVTVVCLCNVANLRGQKAAQRLSQQLPMAEIVSTTTAAQMRDWLRTVDLQPTDLLVINGGDGTLQAILSALLDGKLRPIVAALPGGSTNMTAYDLNRPRNWSKCVEQLEALLEDAEPIPEQQLVQRPLLQIQDGAEMRSGFFFGAGAIVDGIDYYHKRSSHKDAMRREFTAGFAMLRTTWGVLRRQHPFDRTEALSITAEQAVQLQPIQGALLLAVSTLERLLLGIRPFWGQEPVDMRLTLVERDARGLLRSLPGLLGVPRWARPLASAGFHSHNCTTIKVALSGGYTIDGELFKPTTAELRLGLSTELRFLVL